jgi:hypothetical protein
MPREWKIVVDYWRQPRKFKNILIISKRILSRGILYLFGRAAKSKRSGNSVKEFHASKHT